jgi:hypothetical protein
LTKKNVSISTSTRLTMSEVAVLMVVNTPELIAVALDCSLSCIASMARLI